MQNVQLGNIFFKCHGEKGTLVKYIKFVLFHVIWASIYKSISQYLLDYLINMEFNYLFAL